MTQITKRETQLPGMTQKQAMYLLKTIWPKVPDTEIVKAAMICYQYGLNPLMKQIYIVDFNDKNGGKTYSVILGIGATRIIAQQNGWRYSYIDGPRVMTDQEQTGIFGVVDPDKIWAITKIKDRDGNVYPGYGFWPRTAGVHGADKGNTPRNMAFIRSERNALDKMAPGALPDIDVADDAYMEIKDVPTAIEQGKNDHQAAARADADELWPPDPHDDDSAAPHLAQTEADLLAWVCESCNYLEVRTARDFLLKSGYKPEMIAKYPARVQKELMEKMG